MAHAYSTTPDQVQNGGRELARACRRQGIDRISLLASVTGKLTASLDQLSACRASLEGQGLRVAAMVFAVGHPAMDRYYGADGHPPHPAIFYPGPRVCPDAAQWNPLPASWQYAVNEFGNPVYCCACMNEAWLEDNRRIAGELAGVFDEVWYDDEFRSDGDQGAGTAARSTASCYCDACLARLSERLGRTVAREQVTSDATLHAQWVRDKVERLTQGFARIVEAARAVRAGVSVGLMARWGGEERDGIDLDRLRPFLGDTPLVRAGEGHFGDTEYAQPRSQVMEHLACAYHVSWFPRHAKVQSETTYFAPMPRHSIVKKAALALAAGASELAYCPCVDGFVSYQWFIEYDQVFLRRCAEAFADKAALHRPIRIVRTAAAGRGDHRPGQRVRDREYFPWFSQAGLHSTVVRQGGWRDNGPGPTAITGRSAWDCVLDQAGTEPLIVDGTALLERAPLNDQLGIAGVRLREAEGRVEVDGPFAPEGLLLRRGRIWIIPYIWHAVAPQRAPEILENLRRALGPVTGSAYLEGDLDVLLAHHRHAAQDHLMVVNLTSQTRRVTVRLPADRRTLAGWDGEARDARLILGPHAIELLCAS